MGKTRNYVLVLLFLIIAGQNYAQRFNFESQKKQSLNYSQDIEDALIKNDVNKMKVILDKEPSLVNSISSYDLNSKYSVLQGGKNPLLLDVVYNHLYNDCPLEMIQLLLNYKPNMYCSKDNMTPFYLILDYIATQKHVDAKKANNLFFIFAEQPEFNVNLRHNDLAPPLSYLLTKNHEYLNYSFSNEYMSFDIIRTFIKKGASINTRDLYSNSILIYSILIENSELFDFCIENNSDVTIKNRNNFDALYFSINQKNLKNVKKILEKNYPLTENRLMDIHADLVLQTTSSQIKSYLFDILKTGDKDFNKIKTLVYLFPENKLYFITENFNREKYHITTSMIPEFVALFENSCTPENKPAYNNIIALKKEYVFASNDLTQLIKALKTFPVFSIKNYTSDYYKSEINSQKLYTEISNLKDILPVNLYTTYLKEIETRTSEYYNRVLVSNSISDFILLYKNFPSKATNIENTAFERFIANASTTVGTYSNQDYYGDIYNEMQQISAISQTCNSFIHSFQNPEYNKVANKKIQECDYAYSNLDNLYHAALTNYSLLTRKYANLKSYILENGKTPTYEIEVSERTEDNAFSSGNTIYALEFNESIGCFSSNHTFNIQKKDIYDEYCIYSSFILSFTDNCSKSIDETIKRYIFKNCGFEIDNPTDSYSFREMKRIVEYLEKTYQDKWYTKSLK